MVMSRITKETRDRIIDRIIQHRYRDEAQKVTKDLSLFALKVHREAYGKNYDGMMALPEGWLPTTNWFSLQMPEYTQMYINGSGDQGLIPRQFTRAGAKPIDVKNVRIWSRHKGSVMAIFSVTDEVSRAWPILKGRQTDLIKEIDEQIGNLNATLSQLNTVKKLRENWPEVWDLIKDLIPVNSRGGAVMVPVQHLNETLKLPPEE